MAARSQPFAPTDVTTKLNASSVSTAHMTLNRATASSPGTTGVVGGRQVAVTGQSGESQQSMQLREEELQARRTPVEAGQVTSGKEVVTEQRSVDVPVTREEVFVERKAVDRAADRPIDSSNQRSVEVPVHEERVEVQKQPVVYERSESISSRLRRLSRSRIPFGGKS